MLIINQGTSSRFPGYDGPVQQADEITITLPAGSNGDIVSIDAPIPQHIPAGGVVSGTFADDFSELQILHIQHHNNTPGNLRITLLYLQDVLAPEPHSYHYLLTSHDIPKNPEFPVGL